MGWACAKGYEASTTRRVYYSRASASVADSSSYITREEQFMNPPKVVANADPPKEWIEVVTGGLHRHNTAATRIVEHYQVALVIREDGNHIRGGLLGAIWGQWLHVWLLWV